ncbi:SDR family oxidoreductase [Leifsonia shinshuensis]|uniref:SDR family oxidoreductase n=1 Tax=Leifsonia shinshuensis TaxID=150026 RepID=A0A7G6YD48_9MICO|nr:SDR family oxidoreductase [Leifsonia shinshuensis]QNE36413.1 SDR family oxidoreductase [Leifsonia shinshuensis]
MKIVVIGGTGLIGRPLVEQLRQAGHDVVPASPSTGVDTVTGAGVDAALAGADVVVDVPNSPSFEDGPVMEFFQRSTETLVDAEKRAGVGHHVVLSIVGADRMPDIGYMRAKVAQEDIVTGSGVPYTIVRATQFFEFIPALAEGGAADGAITLSPVLMQPIAAADVSQALAGVAVAEPADAIVEFAGPEPIRLADAATAILRSRGDTRPIVADESAGYFGGAVTDESLVPGHDPKAAAQLRGETSLDEWIRR